MKLTEIAMRDIFGEELVKIGEQQAEIAVLDADVSSSTKTIHFGKRFPERFFNVGVAEANMVDIAGGLALCGFKPVVSSFAIFLSLKATEQIRNVICYNKLPVLLVGGYAGLSDSYDGASHQSITDIAVMRAMPNMNIVAPADNIELKQAIPQLLSLGQPAYLRICRNPTPVIFDEAEPFEFGRIRVVKEGTDMTIAASGITVAMAIQAADELLKQGISAEVLNISTIKPLDEKTLLSSVKKTKRIVTVEEHNIIGGVGGAIAEVLSKHFPVPVDYIGINDVFTETGGYDELLDKYGISKQAIIDKVKSLLR